MNKWIWTLLTSGTIAFAGVGVAACGDDSTGGTATDGGKDGSTVDGGNHPQTDGGNNPQTDGGGKCNFATYVIGLTQQPGTATPDTTLGSGCADTASTTTQADFASLFP
jgi:hypothetical protein